MYNAHPVFSVLTPEIDHAESTSENELSDVPEEIINALYSFDCDSDEDFVGFE
jgi:hypothetical protein